MNGENRTNLNWFRVLLYRRRFHSEMIYSTVVPVGPRSWIRFILPCDGGVPNKDEKNILTQAI